MASNAIPPYQVSVGYTRFDTNSDTPPAVIGFNGLIHIFFQDHGGSGIMHIVSTDGIDWSQARNFYTGYTTTAGICPIVYQNVLYLFFRDGNGNGILHIQSSDGNVFAPSQNWYIGLNCDGQPHAAVLESKLCLVSLDHMGTGIMRAIQTAPNGGWNVGFTGYRTRSNAPPCIAAFGGLFHVFFMDVDGDWIVHITSADGVTWSRPRSFYSGFETSAGPAAAVYQGVLYVFFRDRTGNGILQIRTTDGDSWSPTPNSYPGLNCDFQPSVSVVNDGLMALAFVDAGGSGVMRAVMTPR